MKRWKARTDLTYLAREVLGYPDVTGPERFPFMNKLQKFPLPNAREFRENDRISGGKWRYTPLLPLYELPGHRRVLILDPRGWLKTTINAQTHTIQWILNYPDIAMMIIQATGEKAEAILGEVKRHFQHNERFRAIFPEHCPQKRPFDWGTKAAFTTEARNIGTSGRREETVMTGSIDKGLAGYHFDVIKFSDIVEENNVKTKEQIASVIQTFGMCENLLVRPDSWEDVEGTIYDASDLYSELMRTEKARKKDGKKARWHIHVRGVYKKDIPGGKPAEFSSEELDLPYLLDKDGKKISWWPERFPTDVLEERRTDPTIGEYLFACTPGFAPILMADWSDRPISDVNVGDKVVGFHRPILADGTARRVRLVSADVIDKGCQEQEVFCYTLESGKKVYCTSDHLWWNGRKVCDSDTHVEYHTPKIGRALINVYSLPDYNEFQQQELRWLAGFIDADGRVQSNGIIITQSDRVNGHICRRLEECYKNLGIEYHTWVRKEQGTNYYVLNGGRSLRIHLSRLRMAKQESIVSGLWQHSGRVGIKDRIVSCESVGKMLVYWLTTTTGNYISQGFASKNCQQLLNPVDLGEDQITFPVNKTYPHHISRRDFRMNVRVVHRTMSIDMAETANVRSNLSAITVVAWDQAGRAYLDYVAAGKWLPDELVNQIFSANNEFRPSSIKIEKSAFLRGFIASINRRMQLTGVYLPIDFIQRETNISKKERILNTLQPWYKAGSLRFLDDLNHWEELIEELRRFPRYSQDDIIDSLADHFQGKEWFGREQARPPQGSEINVGMALNPWQRRPSANGDGAFVYDDEERAVIMQRAMDKLFKVETMELDNGLTIPLPGIDPRSRTGGL